jgi:hypothetical protein
VRYALAIAVLAGCTLERDVLSQDGEITSCADVWVLGDPGDACDLAAPCTRPTPMQTECCTDFAYCRMGSLVMDTTCNPDCAPCIDDSQCQPGAAICGVAGLCEPCTTIAPCDPMTICPPGWQFLSRNGCPTCECAPPDECGLNPDGTAVCTDPSTGLECYRGANCVDGCPPNGDCCADVCSSGGCMGPAPLGCFMDCDAMMMPMCSMCASTACECIAGNWSCQPVCLDGTMVSLPCVVPN